MPAPIGFVGPARFVGTCPESQPAARTTAFGGRREALAGERETLGQVRGEHAGIAEPLARSLSGKSVEVDAQSGRGERVEPLREQRTDRA